MAPLSTWVGESQPSGHAGVGSAGSQQVPAAPHHPFLTTCCCTSHSPSPWGLILGAFTGCLPLPIRPGPKGRVAGDPGGWLLFVSGSSGGGGAAAVRAAGGLLGHRRHHVHPVSVG